MGKAMVRILRRSIKDLTEDQLRMTLVQVRDTVQSVLDDAPVTVEAEVIDISEAVSEEDIGEFGVTLDDAIGPANLTTGS